MLLENTLFGVIDKVSNAIDVLQMMEPSEGYWLAFSGGKDSVVIKALADLADVKYDAHYNVTSVDPPELIYFIKDNYPDVSFDIPHDSFGNPITMWNLIPTKKMPPTRLVRYCCEVLKESSGEGRLTLTGVRWDESYNRKINQGQVTLYKPTKDMIKKFGHSNKGGLVLNMDNAESRELVESCYRHRKIILNPIVSWSDEDVWEFIHTYKVPYCKLYDKGYKRLGCIGCPMNNNRAAELDAYPIYKQNYLKAFDRMLKSQCINLTSWNSADDVMDWWLNSNHNKQLDGQLSFNI